MIASQILRGDRLTPGLSGQTWACPTSRCRARRPPSPAAKHSASAWPRRSAPALMGVLYILDEPSIGLHQRDNAKLLATLKRLRDLGNTLIVVEHDEDTMYAADYIVDVGPGAGIHGGEITAEGTIDEIHGQSPLPHGPVSQRQIVAFLCRKSGASRTGWLTVRGAKENNLKNIDVKLPLGVFCCVTGVSGSGKSSLINEIVYKHLAKVLNRAKTRAGQV